MCGKSYLCTCSRYIVLMVSIILGKRCLGRCNLKAYCHRYICTKFRLATLFWFLPDYKPHQNFPTFLSYFPCSNITYVVIAYVRTIISIGIFGYLNYLQPRTRQYILEALVKGLQRLEYRGYDSAGVAFDSDVQVNHGAQNLLQTMWGDNIYVLLQKQ